MTRRRAAVARARRAQAFAQMPTRFPTAFRRSRGGTSVACCSPGVPMDQERFRPAAGVTASLSDDGLILLDIDGGLIFSSNAVGGRIWQLVEQAETIDEIAHRLATDYCVSEAIARHDVTAFLEQLKGRGLIARAAER